MPSSNNFKRNLITVAVLPFALITMLGTSSCPPDNPHDPVVAPAPTLTTTHGPFNVVNREVNTRVYVRRGAAVRIRATGVVDFGGAVLGVGAPVLTADGDDWATPSNYPAPDLRKNSLICRVGGNWYQGGTDKVFTPTEDGELVLLPNDVKLDDNSRAWTVTVYVTQPTG